MALSGTSKTPSIPEEMWLREGFRKYIIQVIPVHFTWKWWTHTSTVNIGLQKFLKQRSSRDNVQSYHIR